MADAVNPVIEEPNEVKVEVFVGEGPPPPMAGDLLQLTGLVLSPGVGGVTSVQDLKTPDGKVLITTAQGVAPGAALMGKCLWLRTDHVTWELMKSGGNLILIPRFK